MNYQQKLHYPVKKLILSLFLISIIGSSCFAGKKEKKILFLGSSSTYCHDLPLQVSKWLNRSAGWNLKVYLTGRSGTGFHEYLRPGFEAQYGLEKGENLLEKIGREKYDYVVIQQITYFMSDEDSAEIIKNTRLVCEAAKEAGGEPVFYEMGWRLGPENEVGRKMILREALKNDVALYAPCSRAWKRVRAERPDIELHNLPDTSHPGTLGNYLNLCCFYAAMTEKSPAGLPVKVKYWPPFGGFDKEKAREKLETAQLNYYHEVLPGWMQSIAVMGCEKELDTKTARYLQKVAWKEWKEISKKLKNKRL